VNAELSKRYRIEIVMNCSPKQESSKKDEIWKNTLVSNKSIVIHTQLHSVLSDYLSKDSDIFTDYELSIKMYKNKSVGRSKKKK